MIGWHQGELRLIVDSELLRQDPSLAAEVSALRQRAGGHDNLRFPMDSWTRVVQK